MPLMMVVMPLSGIGGAWSYALSYNRAGKRQRLFNRQEGQGAAPERTRTWVRRPRLDDGS